MTGAAVLASQFAYKRWANEELVQLGLASQHLLSADELRLFTRILNHTWVVDQIFAAHMQGAAHHFGSTNTEDTPTLADLQARLARSDAQLEQYVQDLQDAQLGELIRFRFTDGDTGSMTRSEMLHHLIVHGTYHRGAAGRVLAPHGVALPRDSLTTFLHRLEPERRWQA